MGLIEGEGAAGIENGEFYAQMKATTRVKDLASPELRYRWLETGRQDHFRHAHAFDLLAGRKAAAYVEAACASGDGYDDLLADYSLPSERRAPLWRGLGSF